MSHWGWGGVGKVVHLALYLFKMSLFKIYLFKTLEPSSQVRQKGQCRKKTVFRWCWLNKSGVVIQWPSGQCLTLAQRMQGKDTQAMSDFLLPLVLAESIHTPRSALIIRICPCHRPILCPSPIMPHPYPASYLFCLFVFTSVASHPGAGNRIARDCGYRWTIDDKKDIPLNFINNMWTQPEINPDSICYSNISAHFSTLSNQSLFSAQLTTNTQGVPKEKNLIIYLKL